MGILQLMDGNACRGSFSFRIRSAAQSRIGRCVVIIRAGGTLHGILCEVRQEQTTCKAVLAQYCISYASYVSEIARTNSHSILCHTPFTSEIARISSACFVNLEEYGRVPLTARTDGVRKRTVSLPLKVRKTHAID